MAIGLEHTQFFIEFDGKSTAEEWMHAGRTKCESVYPKYILPLTYAAIGSIIQRKELVCIQIKQSISSEFYHRI